MATCVVPQTMVSDWDLIANQPVFTTGLAIDYSASPPFCSYYLLEQAEFDTVMLAGASPWTLTLADGALIAGAILAVWATGYAFRVLIRVLKHTDENISP